MTPAPLEVPKKTTPPPTANGEIASQSNAAKNEIVSTPTPTPTPSLFIPSHARKGSLDDILSLSGSLGGAPFPEKCADTAGSGAEGSASASTGVGGVKVAPVLSPKIITSEEQTRLKEEKRLRRVQDRIPAAYTPAAVTAAEKGDVISLRTLEKDARAFKDKVRPLLAGGRT